MWHTCLSFWQSWLRKTAIYLRNPLFLLLGVENERQPLSSQLPTKVYFFSIPLFFTESVLRPIQSISRDVREMLYCMQFSLKLFFHRSVSLLPPPPPLIYSIVEFQYQRTSPLVLGLFENAQEKGHIYFRKSNKKRPRNNVKNKELGKSHIFVKSYCYTQCCVILYLLN